MNECVTTTEKKAFIKWFLHNYELQKKEAAWLLSYLASDGQLLARVHFIDSFRHLPKIVLMATKCTQMTPFKFYKHKRVTREVERAFYDIRANPHEDIYIGLFFKDRATCPEYAAVLEGNPMERQNVVQDSLLSLLAEITLEQSLKSYRKKKLYEQIDAALAEGDEEAFLTLTEELRALLAYEQ
ncbi:ReoY family proteolytic degradation factor [Numidum massiliense]|uniref:ReoY family proteolytic degradation factor n=1 Tax=Numidum massiliense TaxID=1522315 RepID=UPI0006D5B2A0|nr:ReoY family proteolytic degradation factor [Numidum massiliense]